MTTLTPEALRAHIEKHYAENGTIDHSVVATHQLAQPMRTVEFASLYNLEMVNLDMVDNVGDITSIAIEFWPEDGLFTLVPNDSCEGWLEPHGLNGDDPEAHAHALLELWNQIVRK